MIVVICTLRIIFKVNPAFLHPLSIHVFAEDHYPFTPQILILTHQEQTAFENNLGKGEIAYHEQFLLFPKCFHSIRYLYLHLSTFLTSYLYLVLNWKSLKLTYQVKG